MNVNKYGFLGDRFQSEMLLLTELCLGILC